MDDPEHDSRSYSSVAAIHTEDHVVWDEPDAITLDRLEVGFVAGSWLVAFVVTAVIFAISTLITAALSDAPLFGARNTDLGVLTILAAMSTFIGFVTTMVLRLVRVEHDRVVNSLAVAAMHVLLAMTVFFVTLAVRGANMESLDTVFTGTVMDRVGNVFTVLERSSVAAIAACLLAIGMVPARGARPTGTQTDRTPQDAQL
jgi:hypothetical protein